MSQSLMVALATTHVETIETTAVVGMGSVTGEITAMAIVVDEEVVSALTVVSLVIWLGIVIGTMVEDVTPVVCWAV